MANVSPTAHTNRRISAAQFQKDSATAARALAATIIEERQQGGRATCNKAIVKAAAYREARQRLVVKVGDALMGITPTGPQALQRRQGTDAHPPTPVPGGH